MIISLYLGFVRNSNKKDYANIQTLFRLPSPGFEWSVLVYTVHLFTFTYLVAVDSCKARHVLYYTN